MNLQGLKTRLLIYCTSKELSKLNKKLKENNLLITECDEFKVNFLSRNWAVKNNCVYSSLSSLACSCAA